MIRRAVLAATMLGLLAGLASPVAATSQSSVRIPRDAVDWATFSPTEKAAAIDYEWHQFVRSQAEERLASITIEQVVPPAASAVEGAATSVTAHGHCALQFVNQAEGTWTRAGGWTDASDVVYYIYAGRTTGSHEYRLIRDGQTIKTTYAMVYNYDWAEAWTGYDFKWWFEHPQYTSRGYHGAKLTSSGPWILGPDVLCSVTGTP